MVFLEHDDDVVGMEEGGEVEVEVVVVGEEVEEVEAEVEVEVGVEVEAGVGVEVVIEVELELVASSLVPRPIRRPAFCLKGRRGKKKLVAARRVWRHSRPPKNEIRS